MLEFSKSKSLKSYNTFGFDVKADLFVELKSVDDFQQLIKTKEWQKNNHLILGGGSNILLTTDYHGLVVVNRISGIELITEEEESVIVKSGAGENWHDFVLYTLSKNWGGLENLSLIPGTVGAAPMQNIGAYGTEIKDNFHSLEAVNLRTGELESFGKEDCQFGYRESVFKHELKDKYLIAYVNFILSKEGHHNLNLDYGILRKMLGERGKDNPSIQDVSSAVIDIRESKLPNPKEIGNSGSFFKNPIISKEEFEAIKSEYPEMPFYELDDNTIKLAAGWLIEQAGWKGYVDSGVGVHKKQALVLVNYGEGKGEDIVELSRKIQDSIQTKFGVQLSPEVNFI